MFKILKSLFSPKSEKDISGNGAEKAPEETKKCKRCLRRVSVNFSRCPHCKANDFSYD